MHALAKLLSREDVLIDVEAAGKKDVCENLAQFFEWRHNISAALTYKSLLARENLGSTAIGHRVAIPHARVKDISHTVGALIRTRNPIHFGEPDGRPVRLVLALLVPEHVIELHLRMLATAAKMFSEEHFVQQLITCEDAADLHCIFTRWPLTS